MVAPEEEEVFWILDFVGEEETYRLQGLLASVHVVAQKQVVGLGRETAVFEQPQKVVELTVDVTCNKQQRLNKLNKKFRVGSEWWGHDNNGGDKQSYATVGN